jgi:hypothetical protein
MIKKYNVLAGEPHEQLRQLAQRWRTLDARNRFQSSDVLGRRWIRQQKRDLERILDGLLREPGRFRGPQIGYLADCMDMVHRHPEFAYSKLLGFELLSERTTGKSAALLGCHILHEGWPEALRSHLKQRISVHLSLPRELYLGQGRMRSEVLLALASQYPRQGIYAQAMIRDLLTGASQHDRDATVKQKAASLLASLD